jgi:chromosome segregation ATPase
MIKALVALANQEFTNTGVVAKIIQAFEGVKQSVVDALDILHADEATSVAHWESEVAEREADNKRLAREINITLGEIDGTENRIFEKETYLADRQQTLAAFTAELEAEQAAFAEATEFYEDVRQQLVHELASANDAYSIIQNAGFGANLSGNLGF